MKSLADTDVKSSSFWLRHPDPTQAAVHLALQWLAYVYPESEAHLAATLRQALPYSDPELNTRWRDFLEQHDIDDHVEALRWLSKTLSWEQVPFLVESCWRLLLVSHDMPSHVPLALRLMARILDVPEFQVLEIGQQVQREVQDEDSDVERAPLLPDDPRYLDRVEWRLYGVSDPVRPSRAEPEQRSDSGGWRQFTIFLAGILVGAGLLGFLVWGPMQLGRQPVPRMSHLIMEDDTPTSAPIETGPVIEQPSVPAVTESGSTGETAPAETDSTVTGEAAADSAQPDPDTAGTSASQSEESETQVSDAKGEDATEAPEAPESSEASTEEPSEEVLMTITASVLNVRAEPSLEAEVVMKLGAGAQVWVDPSKSEGFWRQVRVDETIGYASGRYMTPAE
ncbi:SH3 domain-containing protein [Saccharospirillum salsuginis]|uniref:SH3b domain-containing protein n=1 Tax=Saccharospirillum salsuginis TaxID=418750 RepID=A0A918K348_9GAMM|nr:SH3 domain-containing protein [Saccharospirillum salsuginis]GGX44853.1 hypothetical protein GCM10007392_09570 [Saccharospirillum salsuginis]